MSDIREGNESSVQQWVTEPHHQITAATALEAAGGLESEAGRDSESTPEMLAEKAASAVIGAVGTGPLAAPGWGSGDSALNPLEIEAKRLRRDASSCLAWEELPESASTMFGAPQLEQIVGDNDLVPAYWLEAGSARSMTVCKIDASGVDYANRRTVWGGTAFMVAPNILCTNHHVINSKDVASKSRALFDFAAESDGSVRDAKAYKLRPDLLFWTSATTDKGGLDATFVAVEGEPGNTYGFNQLLRQSFSVSDLEKLNIVQHPAGRMKEVALRNNTVVRQTAIVVHYTSDTERGSSGAPVYNDAWELVALHHASKLVAGKKGNEGIKFSALASAIEQDAHNGDYSARQLLQLFRGTDELMGFFGGLGRQANPSAGGLERVQNAYQGEAQDLDIGFWNIEWFNKRWQDKLDAVARIVIEMNLDVWVLVESSEEAARALASHLKDKYTGDWGVLASQDASSELQITTLLWNTKTVSVEKLEWPEEVARWFAVDSRAYDELGFEAVHGKVFDRYPARYKVTAKLQDKDVALNLVPVHLKAMSEGSLRRQMASRILAEAIAETGKTEGEQGDWMIGGDFNTTIDSGDLAALTDANLVPISAKDAAEQQFTYVKAPYKSLIDHIYVSPNLAPSLGDEFVIVALDKSIKRFLEVSDHRPILVRLTSSPEKDVAAPGPTLSDEELARLTSGLNTPKRPATPGDLDSARQRAASTYYDEAADLVLRSSYYGSLQPSDSGFEGALRSLLSDTHSTQLRYAPAKHLYPWVDQQPNGKLRSIYSEIESTPESFIAHDEEMNLRRQQAMATMLEADSGLDTSDLEALLEAQYQYNCEHVVPQSWFNKAEPMRGDLHHLFSCEQRCNSFRSNYAYRTFEEERVMADCGQVEGGEFEPKGGKGAVARATLYFMLRYKGKISSRYKGEALANLLSWHEDNPPDEWERHRNVAIHLAQGNRNPLIDFPEWAKALRFV